MSKQLYKILVDGRSCNGGSLKWSLPEDGNPGEWHHVEGDLRMCEHGIHCTELPYQWWWKWGCAVYEVETKGIHERNEDKCVCRSARLIREVPKPDWLVGVEEFVASIADVAWLNGKGQIKPAWEISTSRAVAMDAARDAARDASKHASWVVARAASWDASRDAAMDASKDASWNVSRATAWDVAKAASWDASRDAARDVSRNAAKDASWDAAMAVSRDASKNASWDALRDAQLLVACLVVAKQPWMTKHLAHAKARWEVWTSGYGLTAVIAGVFYVYRRLHKEDKHER